MLMRMLSIAWAVLTLLLWWWVWDVRPLALVAAAALAAGSMLIAYVWLGLSWYGGEMVADRLPAVPRWLGRTIGLVGVVLLIAVALTFNPLG